MRAPGAVAAASYRVLGACVWCACALGTAGTVRADVVRFGLFIGNNLGADREAPLRFAVRDAQRMQQVLVDLGGFAPINAVVLQNPAADAARGALIALNDRIRAASARPDTDVLLFVYYSGHADKRALHLGRSRLPLLELEQLVRGSAADVRILLVDACGSGALTRLKGGTRAPPVALRLGERLVGQGVVFLTSSSASEAAQESDELGGSFFTHYFATGLMGAGDFNRDGRIDLEEAYRYAYGSTLRATSRTWEGTQHPTFRFELAGKASVVLTEPRKQVGRGMLVFPDGRDYLVLRGSAQGPVIAEVVTGGARRISVPPARYFVRARADDHVLEGVVEVASDEIKPVEDSLLQRFEYARLVRKGGDVRTSASGVLAGYSLRGSLDGSGAPCHGLYGGYAFVLPSFTLTPRLDACLSGFENQRVRAHSQELGFDVRLSHAWDLPAVTLDLGFALGTSWLRQSFDSAGIAPARSTLALRGSIGPSAAFPLGEGLYVSADAAAETYLFRALDSETRRTRLRPTLALRARLGVGKHW